MSQTVALMTFPVSGEGIMKQACGIQGHDVYLPFAQVLVSAGSGHRVRPVAFGELGGCR